MKVKYLDSLDCELEETINEFIKGKKVIDIKLQNVLDKDDENITSALILYEE